MYEVATQRGGADCRLRVVRRGSSNSAIRSLALGKRHCPSDGMRLCREHRQVFGKPELGWIPLRIRNGIRPRLRRLRGPGGLAGRWRPGRWFRSAVTRWVSPSPSGGHVPRHCDLHPQPRVVGLLAREMRRNGPLALSDFFDDSPVRAPAWLKFDSTSRDMQFRSRPRR
jgi:hypothetical protein